MGLSALVCGEEVKLNKLLSCAAKEVGVVFPVSEVVLSVEQVERMSRLLPHLVIRCDNAETELRYTKYALYLSNLLGKWAASVPRDDVLCFL